MGSLFQNKMNTAESVQVAIYLVRKQIFNKLRLNVLRINLNLLDAENETLKYFYNAGFETAKYYKPNKTFFVDLTLPIEDIFNKIDKGNRRLIKRAEKMNLSVEISNDENYFPQLHRMYLDAKQRKGFTGIDSNEIWYAQKSLNHINKIELIIVRYEKEIIAIHSTSQLGKTAVVLINVNSSKRS